MIDYPDAETEQLWRELERQSRGPVSADELLMRDLGEAPDPEKLRRVAVEGFGGKSGFSVASVQAEMLRLLRGER